MLLLCTFIMKYFLLQERVSRHMQKEHDMRFTDCRRELENAVSDGLIEEYSPPGFKGQNGYRIPEIVDEVMFLAYLVKFKLLESEICVMCSCGFLGP